MPKNDGEIDHTNIAYDDIVDGEIDHTNIVYDNVVDDDEIDDLDNRDALHLNDDLVNNNNNNNDNNNNTEDVGVINQQDK